MKQLATSAALHTIYTQSCCKVASEAKGQSSFYAMVTSVMIQSNAVHLLPNLNPYKLA